MEGLMKTTFTLSRGADLRTRAEPGNHRVHSMSTKHLAGTLNKNVLNYILYALQLPLILI
jgi:hypothetical protein